ncbi:hypothetical protein RG47T_2399 [Mucilaginibacter polytrichastri]|uniref:Oligosaccharide repeat unit polymerase n=1 Tax=Mucilaginibacter polytrichastri TaxID=1302689 RepID=A0A1Q5ZYW4_9SPHI|nr:O-antigen polymerase [Mucilaginibacter polytrichastri]OKS86941.1 hypothetical protein RG47T_2399 [Mucilaginibacter polytrichastri]
MAFIGGFFTFKQLKKDKIVAPYQTIVFEGEKLFLRITFFVCSLLYIIIQLISYKVIGVPLLLGTHIDLYNNAGGWGVLGRIIDVFKPLSIFLLIYFLFEKSTSSLLYVYKYFFLVILIVFFALSGSRSEFMLLGFILFCYIMLNGSELKKYFTGIRKYEVILLGFGMCFVFFTIVFQKNSGDADAGSSIGIFLFRLVASGDVYYFAYPNNNIEHINHSQPFLALFGDIFYTLRIIPRNNQPVVIGFQLFNMFGVSDTIAGPNARHNVFGYIYYGFWGSIVFSYLVGLFLSFTRNNLFFILRKNKLGQALFTLLYLQITVIETDPPMVVSNLETLFLMLSLLFVICISSFILIKS